MPAEPGDAHGPAVHADCSVPIEGDFFDAPSSVAMLYLSLDRGYDLSAGCSIYIYPHSRDILVCILYANGCGLLPGKVRLPIE